MEELPYEGRNLNSEASTQRRPSNPNNEQLDQSPGAGLVESHLANIQEEIEPDNMARSPEAGEIDGDSAYGDEIASYTTSLRSSVTEYKYENGRRYHSQDHTMYFLPNDDSESDRLDLFHHLLTLRCGGKLHMAPIGSNPQRILDLGTGSGIWAIEMGDAYPSALVLGNDLSPIQPTLVPPNVSFEVDDIESRWGFPQPFDYIHCRYLAGSISDWPKLVAQAFEYTKPGGWVEFQDFDMVFYSSDDTFVAGSSPEIWTKEIVGALKGFGREPEPGPQLEGWVREAGFENVNHLLLPIPVGTWPKDKTLKEIGACDLSMFLEGLEAISLRAMTGRGWTAEEILAFLPSVRKDLCNRRIHALHDFHIVWARKPF